MLYLQLLKFLLKNIPKGTCEKYYTLLFLENNCLNMHFQLKLGL